MKNEKGPRKDEDGGYAYYIIKENNKIERCKEKILSYSGPKSLIVPTSTNGCDFNAQLIIRETLKIPKDY